MPRKPDERIVQAEKMFLNGMKLVEIASQLKLPEGTVRRWKSTYQWGNERSIKNTERSDKKSERSKRKKKADNRQQEDELEPICTNPKLTEKQRLFCIFYVKYRNKVKAYQRAYNCNYECACGHASTLWKKVEIQKEIQRLMGEYRESIDVDIKDLFQWHLDIARADMKEFVEWGQEEVPVMSMHGPVQVEDTKTGKKKTLTKKVNVVKFVDSDCVDGTLIAEVKQGRDGASIKLPDKIKSLNWLSEHIGLADEKIRAEISVLRAKAGMDGKEEIADDGFLEALNGSAAEDWADEAEN